MIRLLDHDSLRCPPVTLRLAEDSVSDASAFCELSNSLYARKVTSQYYRWQFFRTPFPTRLVFAVAGDGSVVGCHGMQIRDSNLGPGSVGMALDVMVRQDFQGRGLFRQLVRAACELEHGAPPKVLYVMANARAGTAFVKGIGWTPLAEFQDHVRSTAGVTASAAITAVEIKEFSEADCTILTNLNNRSSPSCMRLSRSTKDLQWRIFANPRYCYQVLRCCARAGPVAFLVLKVFRDPVSKVVTGDVIDVIAPQDDRALAAELLKVALDRFRQIGVDEATTWFYTNTAFDEAGQSLGFRPVERRRYFACRLLDVSLGWLRERARWQVSMLDTDIY